MLDCKTFYVQNQVGQIMTKLLVIFQQGFRCKTAIDNEDFGDAEDDDASTRPIQINMRYFNRNSTHQVEFNIE